MEREILLGQIDAPRQDRAALMYRSGDLELEVQRASSMVAELAPLDLWIRDLLNADDLLVIDEPEAHLHPRNQRLIARVLARVASSGVRVLILTHSSTIVHQISNVVRSSLLDSKERLAIGLDDDDILRPDQVGLYRFRSTSDGVVVDEIPYDPEFGFPEEGFYEVAEAISDETFEIESRLPVTQS